MEATFLKGSLLMEITRDWGYKHVTDLKGHLNKRTWTQTSREIVYKKNLNFAALYGH